MILKKFVSALLICGLALSGAAALTTSADTSEDAAPTLAFDGDDWSKYIDVFDDTGSGAYSLKSERDVVYQGASAKLTANLTNPPDYAGGSEDSMGIMLSAEKFGLDNFDGYTLSFYTRFNVNIEGLLNEDKAYVFGQNADKELTTPTIKTIAYSAASNVNNYEKQFITIPTDTKTTEILIKVPLAQAYTGDVMYLDNLSLLYATDGDANPVVTLDTYNANAPISDKGDVIKQNKKQTTVDTSEVEKSSEGGSVGIIIVIAAAILVIGGAVAFAIVKAKKRFY